MLVLVLNLLALANLRKATIGFVLFVCPSARSSACSNSASTGHNFLKVKLEYF